LKLFSEVSTRIETIQSWKSIDSYGKLLACSLFGIDVLHKVVDLSDTKL